MARKRAKKKQPQGEFWLQIKFFKDRLKSWYSSKASLFGCVFKFIGYLALLHIVSLSSVYQQVVSAAILMDAQLADILLHTMGESSQVSGAALLLGHDCILTVLPACTALEFSWFLIAAILAFPAAWGHRILGVAVGVILMLMLNLVRVVSLYLIGIHWTAYLDIVHQEVWGVILNVATVVFMVGWIMWARPSDESTSHVTA